MVTEKLTEDMVNKYKHIVTRVSYDYAKRYGMLDREDIAQECWLWFLEHPSKTQEWAEMDWKENELLLARSLRNAALKYCVKEKARVEGYHVDDIFWYSKDFIKELLPAVLTEDWRRVQETFTGGSNKSAAEAGDWMAYAADIRKAYETLTEDEQKLVFLFYAQDVDGDTLKEASNDRPTARAAMMVANRAVGKMVKHLGGARPVRDNDYTEIKDTKND